MTADDKAPTSFHKRCSDPACGAWVHRNSTKCKSCGAASPWPPKVVTQPAPLGMVVTQNFSCMVGISLRTFEEGEIITDPALIEQLVKDECPIQPKAATDRVVLCPHCHKTHLLKPETTPQFRPETAEKLRRLGLA